MGKKTPTFKAPVRLPVAGVRVTPKSGWLVKRASYTTFKAMKIRSATATDENDESDIDDEDDYGDDDMDDCGDDDIDDYGDDDMNDYGHDDKNDYGDVEEDDYGHDDEKNTDGDGDDVTPVAHTSSKGRGQHAATDLRTPRRHSVPHTAADCLPLTTVKQTFDVPHALTIAELTAVIEARMSAHMDERIASYETGYKLVMASLTTANAMCPHVPRTYVRAGGRMTYNTSHILPPHTNVLPVHDANILPPCVTRTLPPNTNLLPVRDTNILPPCITHTLPPHTNLLPVHDTNILPVRDTNILPPCITHTKQVLAIFSRRNNAVGQLSL
jgi:hypothetical protein